MKYKMRRRGYSVVELPMAMWILFIGLLFPLVILASMGYRTSILYFAADSAARKAAKAPTYTDAVSRVSTALTTNLATFTGISAASPTISVLSKPITGGASKITKGKLAPGSVDTSKNLYFVITTVDADLDPLVKFNSLWMGNSIPGLTGPFHLQLSLESYCENPNGLTN
jgi:hypothetical protein